MLAGYADIDITPPPGEELTGYGYFLNRRATGTLDPLLARALALGDGERRAVVVQLDLLGLSRQQVDAIRTEAEQRLGLPPQHLMLHCTHTHTGPATVPVEGCGTPSPYYPPELMRRVVTVVQRALEDLREVSRASRFEADFADGFAWNRVGSGDLDTRVRGVELRLDGARPIVVVSYACHPVTLGRLDQYSADYPGYLIRELNAYGTRALYLNGCCGDIDPVSNTYRWGAGTADTLRIYGRDLAAVVRAARASAPLWEAGPLQAHSAQLPVAFQHLDPQALRDELTAEEEHLRAYPDDGQIRVKAGWCKRMLQLGERNGLVQAMTAEVQAIGCGDVVFVALASEAFTRLGQIVRDAVPGRLLLVAATANGVLGYLGTPEDARQNGYASVAAARIYGMAPPTPEAGVEWARAGAGVVRQVAGLSG
jgi:neutral ceramidase